MLSKEDPAITKRPIAIELIKIEQFFKALKRENNYYAEYLKAFGDDCADILYNYQDYKMCASVNH